MARTPGGEDYQQAPTIAPTMQQGGYLTVQATPQNMGAQVGEAMQKLGNTGSDIVEHINQIYADTSARNGIVENAKKLGDLVDEYKQNRGINAANAYKDFQDKATALYNDASNSMPNMVAKKIFQDKFSSELSFSLRDAGSWAAKQTEDGHIMSLNAGIDNSVNQFATAPDDPVRREKIKADIQDQSLQLSHFQGYDEQTADAFLSKHIGSAYSTLIKQTMRTNPEKSEELFNEAVNGSFTATRDGKQVNIPYLDAQERAQVSSEMGMEWNRQAQEELQTAHYNASSGLLPDRTRLVNSLTRAGYNQDFIKSETDRFDILAGSAAQKKNDVGLVANGEPVRNNPIIGANVMTMIDNAADKYNVPRDVMRAVGIQESGLNPNVKVGDNGQAIGMFQLHEGAAKDVGLTPEERAIPEKNAEGGAKYLRQMYDKFGDWDKAVAAFNAGPGTLEKAGGDITKIPQHSQDYLASVQSLRRLDPNALLNKVSGDSVTQYQIARNLTALTPLNDDITTISKTDGSAKDILQNAFDVKRALLAPSGDPAGYVMSHNDALAGAQADVLKKPENLPYYIKTVDNMYNGIEQPENNRPILSKQFGQEQVSGIVSSGLQGGIKTLETMQSSYGENFSRVYGDLVRYGLPPQYQVAMSIDDPIAKQRLAQAYSIPEGDKESDATKIFETALGGKKGEKTVIDTTINTNSTLTDYFKTLTNSGASANDVAAYQNVIKRLAYQNALAGETASDAANNAVKAITGKFTFITDTNKGYSARIPTTIADVVQRNADTFRATVNTSQLTIPYNAISPEYYVHSVKYNSTYVTNNNGTGLWLIDQGGGLVRDNNGKLLTIPFSEHHVEKPSQPQQPSTQLNPVM